MMSKNIKHIALCKKEKNSLSAKPANLLYKLVVELLSNYSHLSFCPQIGLVKLGRKHLQKTTLSLSSDARINNFQTFGYYLLAWHVSACLFSRQPCLQDTLNIGDK